MYAPNDNGVSYTLASMYKASADLSIALGQLINVMIQSTLILSQSMSIIRRAKIETELGYRVPEFVWKTWEYQRRTFGSGNGREIRP